MKTVFIPALLAALVASSCHKLDIASGVPSCVSREIKHNIKNPDWYTGSVKEYEYQGKTVYSFEPDTRRIADGATTIKDEKCNTLCTIGGFGGPAVNQCNGQNFFQLAVYRRMIWEKK
jgi:hypothetical protein